MKILHSLFLFLVIFSVTDAQWTNQNPVPDKNNLNSVFFIDDSTGWIVGSKGFIKKTTNSGSDWIQQNSNDTLTLTSVQFIDENTGWICGEGGLILKTTNSGLTWFELSSGTSEILTDLHFYDLNIGWVVGDDGIILKTTDGGSSWINQFSDTTSTLNSVDFVDDMYGFAVGYKSEIYHKILKTTDGGLNWIDISSSLDAYWVSFIILNTVKFIDANNWFIGGTNGGAEDIWRTTDGGNTWILCQLQQSDKTREIRQLNQIQNYQGITSIYFKDSNIGYAVGNLEGPYDIEIYTTTNGGSTWIRKYDLFQGKELYSVYGDSNGKGWAVGRSGLIFITEDGGNSWKIQGPNLCDLHSLFFINENIGWAAGIGNAGQPGDIILKTTDGGKIWETQLFNNGSYSSIKSMYFFNENIGWAAGDGAVFVTTDGGENWTYTIWGTDITSILFINPNTGWAAGPSGIYKSTDGGINWAQKSFISMSSVYFSDINNGWADGEGGNILKSTDGGETWVTKTSGTVNDLNGVKFYNSNLGMCVGNVGTVLLSTDGGESWVLQNVGTTDTLKAVGFTNSNNIWIAGYNGTILNTPDLGNNWTSYTGITENDLTSLSFVNEYTGWIGGLNGMMFNYSTDPPPSALWTNHLFVKDAGESAGELTFGQFPNATDSIDPALGEYELPPPPITGVFDARFNLPTSPIVSSLIDFRDTSQTGTNWMISFQPGSAGYPMTFSWDSSAFPAGRFYLRYPVNGNFININMKNQSSFTLTEPGITSFQVNYTPEFCHSVLADSGWNMISVPLLAEDMSLDSLFPTAASSAFVYDNGYLQVDTLNSGVGYWLKFNSNEQIQICGTTSGDTIPVKAGWNMIGAYEQDIPLSQITTTPPGIIATYLFGFQDGYVISDTLKSGKGYWVRVTEDGVLNLNSGTLAKSEEQSAKIEQDWGKIIVTDNEGKSITLYAAGKEIKSDAFGLPPLPPAGIFDARYNSGNFVENLSADNVILINSDNYPIRIKAEGINLSIRDRINGELLNEELMDGNEISITNNKITSLVVTGKITEGQPISYQLFQNYPNPFNPSTTIRFSIPKEVQVNLSVYNILGERIKEIKNEVMKPGYYTVEFNASTLASGVYIYRIIAGNFTHTKKMILLK